MTWNSIKIVITSLLSILIVGCGPDNSDESVSYKLTFKSNWDIANFPTNFPSGVTHFSPIIGMTHNTSASLFSIDSLATLGVELVAETGATSVIKQEIGDIQNLGNSQSLIEGFGLPNGQSQLDLTFSVDKNYSLVSVITMIAPSPDWFVGVDSLNLYPNGDWVDEVAVDLKVYDSGTDDGVRFTSSNANSIPKVNVTTLTSNSLDTDFEKGVHRTSGKYIGTFIFKRQ